jgi:hypothetical protein
MVPMGRLMQPGRPTGAWHRTADPPRHRQFTCQRNRGIGVVNFPVLRIFGHLVIIRRTCGHAAKPGRRSLELMLARAGRSRSRDGRSGPGGDAPEPRCATLIPARNGAAVTGRAMGDWLSGRAPRSHRGGHWFDPSIAHEPACAGRWPPAAFRVGRSIFPGARRPRTPCRPALVGGLRPPSAWAAVSSRGRDAPGPPAIGGGGRGSSAVRRGSRPGAAAPPGGRGRDLAGDVHGDRDLAVPQGLRGDRGWTLRATRNEAQVRRMSWTRVGRTPAVDQRTAAASGCARHPE